MNRLVNLLVRIFLRWMPDAFVVAGLLTLLTFLLSVGVARYSVTDTLNSWGDSFWNLLTFTNQITLTLLFGYALANTPPVRRLLLRIAGLVRTPVSAYMMACFVTGLLALVSWGLSLIAAGILSRAIGETCRKKGIAVHYPLLVASAFSGFVIWHQGLSSSVALTLATPGHFLEDQVGLISISKTLFVPWNAGVVVVVLLTLPLVMAWLRPRQASEISEIPEHLMADEKAAPIEKETEEQTPAIRMERSLVLNLLLAGAGAYFLWTHFVVRGDGLTLNAFNFAFLIGGMLLAGSPIAYVRIIVDGGRVAAPFLLQYPFYAGIAGVMNDSGLARMVVDLFVSLSSASTLPFFGFLSGGVLNLFVPSGGGQWAVQGPIMMTAAQQLDADLARTAMAVALGDQWTNLIQPLALMPVLAIAMISLREIMAYCLLALFWTGLLFSAALLIF